MPEDLYEKTYDALHEALEPLDLGWTVEGLLFRLKDVGAFSNNPDND